ncbi:amino acid permease family protein [Amylolactobacillus amylotrophicus DSM 20534]|uniref:Amino acid permease family protein n=3 Tax=Amylolactobacillus TaxID=2767876 RepID=A0A0R1YJ09_9LACO|nr:amino acid permease family protein [Amylolactobacillus amylotrophicus DSM 20534]KRM42095.1 amino acid permease family protein [Amylolactobacillus amylophilus DSM 20533 = JCM 1125]
MHVSFLEEILMGQFKQLLLGKPLKSDEEGGQKLTRFKALAMLSSDALSSVAYGTEEIALVLVTLSAAAMWYSIPIAAFVLVLLLSLTLSYRQVIHAYPGGGGAYKVSSDNLGKGAGLVAGGSLLIDYMLTVAVSVSAGSNAIVAAIPALYGHQVVISLVIITILTILNLRGMSESANFLMIPVYFFIVMILIMIGTGLFKILTGQIPFTAAAPIGAVVPGVTAALIFKAFSSGSSSLTGVEAISNAVPFFKKPRAKNAAATLTIMAAILGVFFAGISFLNYWYGIVPMEKVTVLSQIADKTFGGQNIFYYLVQFATAFILTVAANTGFSAFPVLAFNLAKDKFMPHNYMDRGDRLGYSNGILTLAIGSGILIVMFGGDVSRLIPLYAAGVFIPFTLSQTGMILKWWHERPKNWVWSATANLVGALISFAILVILFTYRLAEIWPFFVIMPALVYLFHKINQHYKNVAEQLRLMDNEATYHQFDGSTVIVLVSSVTQVTKNALSYAESIGDYVIAMHVSMDENPDKEKEIQSEFTKDYPNIRFVDIHSSYRSIVKPVSRFVDVISRNAAQRNYSTTVLIPQFVPNKNWHFALHNQTALRLKQTFMRRENIIVATYSYNLKK